MERKDGTPLPVLKNAAILKDSRGKVVAGVENFTDLSEVEAKERVISHLRRELSREEPSYDPPVKSPDMMQLFILISSADRTRVGRFEAAHGGDIFLDEVGDLPMPTQAKLLRVLQEKVIEKVGDHAPIPVNVRFITATNKDLHRLMALGRFREDLYYRIGVHSHSSVPKSSLNRWHRLSSLCQGSRLVVHSLERLCHQPIPTFHDLRVDQRPMNDCYEKFP